MKPPSPLGERILHFLHEFIEHRGYPPSIRDIVKGCHLSSTSVVEYHLNILKKEGYLHRDPEVSRGITLVGEKPGRRLVAVPVIGCIAAGEPIPVPGADTWDNLAEAETLYLPQELTRGKESVYALRVKGNSMLDALIGDGDLVLMEQVNTADTGEMVAVWFKAEKEATLKRFYLETGHIRLQPANSQMQPIYADPDNIEIQGKVLCVIRQIE